VSESFEQAGLVVEPDLALVGGAYAVKLPVFEGPLDLLLHLIRQNEVEITEIPIAQICDQYLRYLEVMQELRIDIAADYLVMAATLALIKSRMLLPPSGEEDEDDGLDPRADLVARLLEYQRYKEVAEQLAKRRLLGRDVFEAQGSGPEPVPESEREIEVGLFQLLEALSSALKQAPVGKGVYEVYVEAEAISVRERMIVVMEALEGGGSLEFTQLVLDADGRPASRPLLVSTFLAILELARLTALKIYQGIEESGVPRGPIRLRSASTDHDGPHWRERMSEHM